MTQTRVNFHRPVCPKCHCELKPERNGVAVLDLAAFGPYKLWSADLWKCRICKIEIIAGFASEPISTCYEPDFKKQIDLYKSKGLLIENID